MILHWQHTRRVRRLAMPLPTKPKRPLGPPVLFGWQGIAVRTRADIEAAGHTWDEFLDSVADIDDIRCLDTVMLVLELVPVSERRDLHLEILQRRMDRHERQAEEDRMRRFDQVARQPWFQRFLRRA